MHVNEAEEMPLVALMVNPSSVRNEQSHCSLSLISNLLSFLFVLKRKSLMDEDL